MPRQQCIAREISHNIREQEERETTKYSEFNLNKYLIILIRSLNTGYIFNNILLHLIQFYRFTRIKVTIHESWDKNVY